VASGGSRCCGLEVRGNGWRLELLCILEEVFDGLVGCGCKRRMELDGGAPMAGGGQQSAAVRVCTRARRPYIGGSLCFMVKGAMGAVVRQPTLVGARGREDADRPAGQRRCGPADA
jgi:hypothetical protein